MKFAELYTAHGKFMRLLIDEAVRLEESSYYHLANIWLSGLVNDKKPQMYLEYLDYLKNGSSIKLKNLLSKWIDFEYDNLYHFNVFAFIDSSHSKFEIK
jgi:hypothetical protein